MPTVRFLLVSVRLLMVHFRIPENVRFVIGDFESQWTFGKDSFDLIHLRVGTGSVSSWSSLFRKAYEWV